MNPMAEVTLKRIESYVRDTLNTEIKQRFQDEKAVELEITEKIADRAIKWAKVFGFFAGIPLAIFAIILSFLGIKTYSDLQKSSEKVTTATSQLGEAQKTLKSAQESSQKLIDATAQVESDIQKRLKALLENIVSIEKEIATARVRLEEIPKIKERQEQLETEIREIEKRVSFERSAELTPEIQGRLETSLEKYLNYLNDVGFPRNPTKVKIKVEKATTALAYYRSGDQTIVIDSQIVNDEHVAFREYTHHVLIHGTQARFLLDQDITRHPASPLAFL
jgi:uncharacterized protein YoxC